MYVLCVYVTIYLCTKKVREEAAERKVLREAKEKLCAAIRDVEAATNYRRRSAFRKV